MKRYTVEGAFGGIPVKLTVTEEGEKPHVVQPPLIPEEHLTKVISEKMYYTLSKHGISKENADEMGFEACRLAIGEIKAQEASSTTPYQNARKEYLPWEEPKKKRGRPRKGDSIFA